MKSSIYLCRLGGLVCAALTLIQFAQGHPQRPKITKFDRRDLPPVPPGYDNDKDTYERYLAKSCSTDQIAIESRGWAEAGVLANALNAWKPTSDYQNAMDMYMGTDSTDDKPGWIYKSYKDRIQYAVTRDNNLHVGQAPARTYAYVYCDENAIPKQWDKSCNGTTGGYTWSVNGLIWTNHFLVLCPNNFFDEKKSPTLSTQLRAIRDNETEAKDIYSIYWNIGSIYLHETFHWANTVTYPQAHDYDPDNSSIRVYGPEDVKKEAATKNAYANSVIADAYTEVASAMLLMQIFKLPNPPTPNAESVASNSGFRTFFRNDVPSDWKGPQDVNDSNSQPDMSYWQKSEKVQIDMADYAVVSDAGGDAPAPATPATPPPSKPQCGANGYTAPYADVDNINHQLDAKGGQQCCTTSEGGCTNIGSSGKTAVDLCSDPGQSLCVDCARLANYVAGLESGCQQGAAPNIMVGGTQDIVETPGLKVEI